MMNTVHVPKPGPYGQPMVFKYRNSGKIVPCMMHQKVPFCFMVHTDRQNQSEVWSFGLKFNFYGGHIRSTNQPNLINIYV